MNLIKTEKFSPFSVILVVTMTQKIIQQRLCELLIVMHNKRALLAMNFEDF